MGTFHHCTVYNMAWDPPCHRFLAFEFILAAIYCVLFMTFVWSMGQDVIRRAFQTKNRFFFLCLGLICADIQLAVFQNRFYFIQLSVNTFSYLLFACAAVFQVQFTTGIVCGVKHRDDDNPMRCLWKIMIVVLYYVLLIQSFIAIRITTVYPSKTSQTSQVPNLVQAAVEITVVVECFMLPVFVNLEAEPTGNNNRAPTVISSDEAFTLTHVERRRCRMCVSAFIVVQFVALWVKYLLPDDTRHYECAVYRWQGNPCRSQLIVSLVQAIAFPFLFCVLVCNIAALNKRLLLLCALLTVVNIIYLVCVQLPHQNWAYLFQVIVDPMCAIINGLAAVLEVQHRGDQEPLLTGFVWRSIIAVSYIVLLVS